VTVAGEQAKTKREWLARLQLQFSERRGRTVLAHSMHTGPLRVQRAFYPEADGCCHVYLLHPPGGLAIGDKLEISAAVECGSALLTTPSAAKIYGTGSLVENGALAQEQCNELHLGDEACLEWLPQETIVFDRAQVSLSTRVHLGLNSKFLVWDIVRLGRIASGETFTRGTCQQRLEVWRAGRPLFLEKNLIKAGSDFVASRVGLQNKNSLGTLLASLQLTRDEVDDLYRDLSAAFGDNGSWALTQKEQLFIARYLGDTVEDCRAGFELLWRSLRPKLKNQNAISPRIWSC